MFYSGFITFLLLSSLLVFLAEDLKIKHNESREIVVCFFVRKVRCRAENPKQVGKQDV